jgi:hypothetical protein
MVYSLTFNTQTQIEQAIGQADHNSRGATARLEAQPGACTSFAIARWPAAHPSAWLPVLQGPSTNVATGRRPFHSGAAYRNRTDDLFITSKDQAVRRGPLGQKRRKVGAM